jgi:hypothetical protein
VDTGKPFTLQDACVTRGASIGFDPNANREAQKAVKAFLIDTFKLTPTAAQTRNQLVGTYRLISYKSTSLVTGETTDLLGKAPHGYISYGPEGRMMVFYVSEERPKPANTESMTDQDRIGLFKTMNAYSGTYDFDGKVVTHHVDVSSNHVNTNKDLVRNVKLEGRKLVITTTPQISPFDGKPNVVVLTFEKVD